MGDAATVVVNEEKPGRGNFVVRVNGTPVIELLALKRPFPPLKALDMEDVAARVLQAIEEASSGPKK